MNPINIYKSKLGTIKILILSLLNINTQNWKIKLKRIIKHTI